MEIHFVWRVDLTHRGKIKLPLCCEDQWGSGDIALSFLTSALDGGEWSVSRPGRFILGEGALGTHWV
jgi:hypothetical protein